MTTYNQNKSSSLTGATEELDPAKRVGDRTQRRDGSWSTGIDVPAPPSAPAPLVGGPGIAPPQQGELHGGLIDAPPTPPNVPKAPPAFGPRVLQSAPTPAAAPPQAPATPYQSAPGVAPVSTLPIPAGSIIKMGADGKGQVVDPRTNQPIGALTTGGNYQPTPAPTNLGLRQVKQANGTVTLWSGALGPGMSEMTVTAAAPAAAPATQSTKHSALSAVPQQVPPPVEATQSTTHANASNFAMGTQENSPTPSPAGATATNVVQGLGIAGSVAQAADRQLGGGTITPKTYHLVNAPPEYNLAGYLKDADTGKLYPPGSTMDPNTGDITLGHGINGQTGQDMFGTVIKRDVAGLPPTAPPAGAVPQNQNPMTSPGIPAVPQPTPGAPVTGGNANTGQNAQSTIDSLASDQLLKDYLRAGIDDIRASASAQKQQVDRAVVGADSGRKEALYRRIDQQATKEANRLELDLKAQAEGFKANKSATSLQQQKLAFDQATQKAKDNLSIFNTVLQLGAMKDATGGSALFGGDPAKVEGATSVDDRSFKLGGDYEDVLKLFGR